jgi:hypothetical protein
VESKAAWNWQATIVAALIGLCLLLSAAAVIVKSRPEARLDPDLTSADSCSAKELKDLQIKDPNAEKRREIICETKRWRNWYYKEANSYYFWWSGLTYAVIALSVLTSVISGLGLGTGTAGKYITVAAPALAAAIVAGLSQFNIAELWHIREKGRLEIIALEIDARALDSSATDLKDKIAEIRKKMNAVDQKQAELFFSTIKNFNAGSAPSK